MTRYVFITGGVVSSLGKGLTSAALGALMQARGFKVRLRKLDPYLNVDPGTLSPFEHGEVFVTDDGTETDLDIGHYERFTGVAAESTDSTTSGRIYQNVLDKERQGKFLGETIQVIPHVTDEIKKFIGHKAETTDFMLCEIGGTIGDIEGLPFFEAIRQFAQEAQPKQCIFIHVTLIPYLDFCNELKTKPTQHSVKELRSIGLTPDILVCRCPQPIPEKERDKIALFCNVRKDYVVSSPDLKSIYDAPTVYAKHGLDQAVLDAFGIDTVPEANLKKWCDVSDRLSNTEESVNVAIVGKYTSLDDAYKSINEAIIHGGIANRVKVNSKWYHAETFEEKDPSELLEDAHAILIPGGFGKRGSEGKINVVEFARKKKIPYFGICFGMQMAVIEIARNVLGLKNAGSEEFKEEGTENSGDLIPIVYYLKRWVQDGVQVTRDYTDQKGATMRLGSYPAVLQEGSLVAHTYGKMEISERHRHRYEVNVKFKDQLEQRGIYFSGISPDGQLPEVLEISDHPWFVGVQFHPELKSRPFQPHPLFASFIEAGARRSRELGLVK